MGLRDLHAAGVVHRNLKPKKILLDGDHPAISIDDLSTMSFDGDAPPPQSTGTLFYMVSGLLNAAASGLWTPATCPSPSPALIPFPYPYRFRPRNSSMRSCWARRAQSRTCTPSVCLRPTHHPLVAKGMPSLTSVARSPRSRPLAGFLMCEMICGHSPLPEGTNSVAIIKRIMAGKGPEARAPGSVGECTWAGPRKHSAPLGASHGAEGAVRLQHTAGEGQGAAAVVACCPRAAHQVLFALLRDSPLLPWSHRSHQRWRTRRSGNCWPT